MAFFSSSSSSFFGQVCLSACLPACLPRSVCLSVCLSLPLSVSVSCLSACLSLSLSLSISVCLPVPAESLVCLFVCRCLCLCLSLSVCLCVSLSVSVSLSRTFTIFVYKHITLRLLSRRHVIALFKSAKSPDLSNYRPIFILSVILSKLSGKHINKHVLSYFKNNLSHSNQAFSFAPSYQEIVFF